MSNQRREGAEHMKEDLEHKTSEVVDQAKQKTGEAMDQARESAFAMMGQQKTRAAEGLGSVASALRQTGESLRGSEQGAFAQYAERAADKVEQVAGQLRDKDMDELLYEAERFARREPELFLGGAVLLGLLASRFVKASNSRRASMRQGYYPTDYRSGGYESGSYRGSYSGDAGSYRPTGMGGYRTSGTGGAGATSVGSRDFGETSMGSQGSTTSGRYTGMSSGHTGREWAADEDETSESGSSQA